MYSQFLYFIIVLLLFTMQQPGSSASLSLPLTASMAAAVWGLLALAAYRACRGMSLAASDFSQSNLAARYHRLQFRLQILALSCFAFEVYVLDVKFYFNLIPFVEKSLSLSGLIGLALYLSHTTVIWFFSHPAYQAVFRSAIRRSAFIKTHLSFSSAILLSWLLVAIASDLLEAFKPFPPKWTATGEYAVLAGVMVLFMFFAPGPVVRLWGCRPLLEQPLRAELEIFCRKHGFRVGDFMLWPLFGGEMLTAGIVGVLPRMRYILVTRGLLSILNPEELRAVVAHEMGHVRRFHLPMFLLFLLSYLPVAGVVSTLFLFVLLDQDIVLEWVLSAGAGAPERISIISSVLIVLLFLVFFRFIFGYFLRNCERQADLYAMNLMGDPYPLITSLQKIALHSGRIEDLPSWHHYSIRQRIECLIDSSRDTTLIRRHNRKLYASALAFFVSVAVVFTTVTGLLNSSGMRKWTFNPDRDSVERALREEPGNPDLLASYGGLLLEAGRIGEAERLLRKALHLSPDDPSLMNNLAWLYATSPPPHHNPEAALKLAAKAAELRSDAVILDTLAEAYYVNGRYREAVDTIEKALRQAQSDHSEYLTHKEKYQKALAAESDRS
ncbi:M48 family metallopeptidase [Syntrophobacter fumaroxidans]|uniref:Tetratricopeptide TPR_2 repeat protein n=1 Tax=Syntrophobacter fumaroxidans (strain DSM 10017 / MPOB) TaxID=335543 RepID=A0LE57_SYNFM|nr:M48 family metallopeptidase [Syntrophobacter fumaroxidans]ABK15709.1 Tetratricopeptide TPR_2 repeat protein [Syntrophobacter fumaroxidans MPOB]